MQLLAASVSAPVLAPSPAHQLNLRTSVLIFSAPVGGRGRVDRTGAGRLTDGPRGGASGAKAPRRVAAAGVRLAPAISVHPRSINESTSHLCEQRETLQLPRGRGHYDGSPMNADSESRRKAIPRRYALRRFGSTRYAPSPQAAAHSHAPGVRSNCGSPARRSRSRAGSLVLTH